MPWIDLKGSVATVNAFNCCPAWINSVRSSPPPLLARVVEWSSLAIAMSIASSNGDVGRVRSAVLEINSVASNGSVAFAISIAAMLFTRLPSRP